MTFNITVVLAFVRRGGRWYFGLAVKRVVAKKSLKTTVLGDELEASLNSERSRLYFT